MESTLGPIDWTQSNDILLKNPKASNHEQKQIEEVFEKAQGRFDEPHVWISSSGSSKKENESPKVVGISQKALYQSAIAVNLHLAATNNDKWGLALPDYHVGGLGIWFRASLLQQKPEILISKEWNPKIFTEKIEQTGVTLTTLVPTQVFDLIEAKLTCPKHLRAVIVGGGVLSQNLRSQAIKAGWPVLPSYGTTETASQIATADLSTLSNPDSNVRLKILSHAEMKVSSEGLMSVRAQSMASEILQIKNGQLISQTLKASDWLETEDLAEIIDGQMSWLGRSSDFVKVFGVGVSLEKIRSLIESQIDQNIKPNNWALMAVPDARQENKLVLAIEDSKKDFFCSLTNKRILESLSAPERYTVKFIKEIPRSPLGKVLKSELEKLLR